MVKPVFERIPGAVFRLNGVVGEYVRGVTEQWLLVAPRANPAMLEMFRDRDCTPLRDLVPWAGEFAGKYLTAAVQNLRVTRDLRLRRFLRDFVARLVSLQDEDGYLGPWPKDSRIANHNPHKGEKGMDTWDTWGHYHIMMGLMLWHEDTGDRQALACARRIGDLICRKYAGKKQRRLVETGSTEMNLAPAHSLCILYRKTKEKSYLDMALQIVAEFAAEGEDGPLAGNYLLGALGGKQFYQLPKPRWESLHPIMALAELYWITGDERYRRAFEHLWWSMVRFDRHNGGGFTSGERATGNPYDLNPIETCCTIAWMAMSVEMLKMTGNSVVADELELSTLNSVLGMHSSTGRWATYNTPMNGIRRASAHSIVFQAREGQPELNCCSVNSPRGFGIISDWALMRDADGLVLNWYGPSKMTANAGRGLPVTLLQQTEYPVSGSVCIRVSPAKASEFCLKLRIPYWSENTRVKLNGGAVSPVEAGTYLRLERRWKRGDVVQLDLDMSLHFWAGERECKGKASAYRGPVLLAYDHRYNLKLAPKGRKRTRDYDEWKPGADLMLKVPALDATRMKGRLTEWKDWHAPMLLLEFDAANGKTVRLCDYGSAGEVGTPYLSWLPIRNAPATEFSMENPLRSGRP